MKAVFDLEHWQPSYTIAVFLAAAEQERLRRGHKSIDVEIMAGSLEGGWGRYKYWPSSPKQCDQMMDHVVLPMIKMLPSVSSVSIKTARRKVDATEFQIGHKYAGSYYFNAYERGIRPFRPVGKVDNHSRLITMTLRECGLGHWGARDSDVPEWCHAAGVLEEVHGYDVVIVRDTRFAERPLHKLNTDPNASKFLNDRAVLYSSAKVNLFVSNGPAWFALGLDVPMVMFRPTCEDGNKNSRAVAMAREGIETGRQMKGAPPYQRLAWCTDASENIVNETLKFLGKTGIKQAGVRYQAS